MDIGGRGGAQGPAPPLLVLGIKNAEGRKAKSACNTSPPTLAQDLFLFGTAQYKQSKK